MIPNGPNPARELFVSYASEDTRFAEWLVTELETRGVSCWFAKRDVNPGKDYPTQITQAINNCAALVLVFSAATNRSAHLRKHILREVELAAGKFKPIFPVRIENVEPEEGLTYFLRTVQWLELKEWERLLPDALIAALRNAPDPPHPSMLAKALYRLGRRLPQLAASLFAAITILTLAYVYLLPENNSGLLPAPSDPAEILTRRGYALEQQSLYKAIKLGRREDLDLLLKAGLTFNDLPIKNANIPVDTWNYLVDKGAVKKIPCAHDDKSLSDDSLLSDATRYDNLAIYKSLCNGQYFRSIVAAATTKLKEESEKNDRAMRDYKAQLQKFEVSKTRCIQRLDAELPDPLVFQYMTCQRALKTEVRKQGCQASAGAEDVVKSVKSEMNAAGFRGDLTADTGDCIDDSCRSDVLGKLSGSYYYVIIRDKGQNSEYRRRKMSWITDSCSHLKPKEAAKTEVFLQHFYNRVLKL
jgi:hypothetical protein